MPDITLTPFTTPPTATITPPGSKSLTNRALVLAAVAKGTSTLTNILLADDTRVMLDGLIRLGFDVRLNESEKSVTIAGTAGRIPNASAELFCGNSGTTIRFLAALCSIGHGTYTLDGVPRMRQRPIGELIDTLKNIGVRADYPAAPGYPPVTIHADGLAGGVTTYGSAASSQFLSAVAMVGPFARHELRVHLESPQTSWPYVAMTLRLMDVFGHTPELIRDPSTGEPKTLIVPIGQYNGTDYPVEPDASNAAYFWAVAAVHPGASVTIPGLGSDSLQGDVGIAKVLGRMGASVQIEKRSVTVTGTGRLDGIDVDLSDMPDQAQTIAVVAMLADGESTLRGLKTLRVKETDRLTAVATELRKFGAIVTVGVDADGDDTMTILPPKTPIAAAVDTYDDHRMAMSFAVAGTKIPGVTIRNAGCVNKTYPEFFEDLNRLRS
jgi:3-phosphoshikimate 1-carboxyvinyltransferase